MTTPSPSKPPPGIKTESEPTDLLQLNDEEIDMVHPIDPTTLQPQNSSDPSSEETLKSDKEVRQEALDLTLEEARMPLRKDVSLREFLGRMDEYAPIVSFCLRLGIIFRDGDGSQSSPSGRTSLH